VAEAVLQILMETDARQFLIRNLVLSRPSLGWGSPGGRGIPSPSRPRGRGIRHVRVVADGHSMPLGHPMKCGRAIPALAVALGAATAPLSIEFPLPGPVAPKAQLCASCHGRRGLPSDHAVPIIWGQQPAYLQKQLRDYRNGDRDNEIMSSIAQSLSEGEIAPIANFFGSAKWPEQRAASPLTAPDAIAACKACHGPNLTGGTSSAGMAPRLAGQLSPYLFDTMTAYASGERGNSTQMLVLMRSVSLADRRAIAGYLGALR
jgi:cytochrome c553